MKLVALAILATAMGIAMNPPKASAAGYCSSGYCSSCYSACDASCNGDNNCEANCKQQLQDCSTRCGGGALQ
ncbi:MAG TPA: hypothetical protein VKZ53_08765 [Candidatus Angelobacter sp.]|nr:hypothetical protein [Candidatus Angelobacter sp.]